MAKIVNKPILALETHEVITLSKTINLLREIAENEEMRDWCESAVDLDLLSTIENLDTLLGIATVD